jgi:hypothetical protein
MGHLRESSFLQSPSSIQKKEHQYYNAKYKREESKKTSETYKWVNFNNFYRIVLQNGKIDHVRLVRNPRFNLHIRVCRMPRRGVAYTLPVFSNSIFNLHFVLLDFIEINVMEIPQK